MVLPRVVFNRNLLKCNTEAGVYAQNIGAETPAALRKGIPLVFKHGLYLKFPLPVKAVVNTKTYIGTEIPDIEIGCFSQTTAEATLFELNEIVCKDK